MGRCGVDVAEVGWRAKAVVGLRVGAAVVAALATGAALVGLDGRMTGRAVVAIGVALIAIVRWMVIAGGRPPPDPDGGATRIQTSSAELRWRTACVGSAAFAVVAAVVSGVAASPTGDSHVQRVERFENALAERLLARDLAPFHAYAAPVAFGMVAVVCVVLLRLGPGAARGGAGRGGVVGGVVIGLALGLVAVTVGTGARTVEDRRADAADLDHRVHNPVGPFDADPAARLGPEEPTEAAWNADLARGIGPPASLVVPGRDALLVLKNTVSREFSGTHSEIVARGIADGRERWRWGRDGPVHSVTVDPANGRVLLVASDVALVLDLADGRELRTRSLPGSLRCTEAVSSTVELIPPFGGMGVGTAAWVECVRDEPGDDGTSYEVDELALIDVATGDVLARGPRTRGCNHAGVATDEVQAVLQWSFRDGCRWPKVVAPDGKGGIAELATLPITSTAAELYDEYGSYDFSIPTVTCGSTPVQVAGDRIVVSLDWSDPSDYDATCQSDGEPREPEQPGQVNRAQVVALSVDSGDVLWQRDDLAVGHQAVALTDDGVLLRVMERIGDPGEWLLLSLDDGDELARRPDRDRDTSAASSVAVDGERIYTPIAFGSDTRPAIVVRRAEDLVPLGTFDSAVEGEPVGAATAGGFLAVPFDHADGDGIIDLYEVVVYGPG